MIGTMRTLLAYLDTPLLIGDLRNVAVYVNPSWSHAFGKSAPEIVGKDVLSLFPGKSRGAVLKSLDIARKGTHERLDVEVGEYFFKMTISPITGDAGNSIGFIMGLLDLTRERKFEQSRMDVTAHILNDLRDPLRRIHKHLEFIEGRPGAMDRETLESVKRAHADAETIERMINELLGLSAPPETKRAIKQEEFDLIREVKVVLQSMDPVLKSSGIALENLLPRELPHVIGDSEKIGQALMNLLSFAVRQVPPADGGGRTAEASLTVTGKVIRQKDGQEYILVTVSSSWDGQGEGLDTMEMTSVRQVVEAHSGTFTVLGDKGMGTTYSLVLPAKPRSR